MSEDQFQQLMQEMRTGFSAVGARFDKVDARMDALHTRMNEVETFIDDLNRRIANVEQNLSYVAKNTEAMLDRIRIVTQRVDRLENPGGQWPDAS